MESRSFEAYSSGVGNGEKMRLHSAVCLLFVQKKTVWKLLSPHRFLSFR